MRRYCKPQHAFYDLAADVMAENPQYVAKHLNTDMQDFLQATIMQQVCVRACVCACVCVRVSHSGPTVGMQGVFVLLVEGGERWSCC